MILEIRQIFIPVKTGIQSFREFPGSRRRGKDKMGMSFKGL